VEGKLLPAMCLAGSKAGSHRVVVELYMLGLGKRLNMEADVVSSKSPLRLLTKGDNNAADDTELYATGQSFLNRKEDVIGSVVGFIPFVGYVTILLSEYPWLKQAMLGIMGLMVVLQRE